MGPLATMFANIKSRNDAAQRDAGFDRSPEMQRLFNSRLSPVFEGMNTGRAAPDGGDISLDGGRPHGGMLEQESVFAPRRGQGPVPFRDPSMQAGPEPPVDPRILARLFGDR